MDKSVLIISNPEDEHTARVAAHIRQIGGVPILFYQRNWGTVLYFALITTAQDFQHIRCSSLTASHSTYLKSPQSGIDGRVYNQLTKRL